MISLSTLLRDRRGVAVIEFAYAMPVLLTLGFMGSEVASLAITNMKLSQATLTAADNASRLGTRTDLNVRQLWERDINDVFAALDKQAPGMKIYSHGRMIISSVQRNAAGKQTIAWQRCRGMKQGISSRFGEQGTVQENAALPLPGLDQPNRTIMAQPNGAVILVEASYDYQPIADFGFSSLGHRTLSSEAVFTVRDNRDLSQVFNTPGGPTQNCDVFTE